VPVIELETMPDHVHPLVRCDPLAAFTVASKRSKAGPAGGSVRSSRQWSRLPTPTDQRTLRRHRLRRNLGGRQRSMLRISPTRTARPYLPTVKAGGFTGVFR
jgi:hypothetical protein